MNTAQQITIGSKVTHYRKNWSQPAVVTNLYIAPGYGVLTAALKHEVGTGACAVDCLRVV